MKYIKGERYERKLLLEKFKSYTVKSGCWMYFKDEHGNNLVSTSREGTKIVDYLANPSKLNKWHNLRFTVSDFYKGDYYIKYCTPLDYI